MLVTIYEKRYNRFIPIKQYYQWTVPFQDGKIPCPGCGRELTFSNLTYSHVCDGKLTDKPIARDRFKRNLRWTPKSNWDPIQPV